MSSFARTSSDRSLDEGAFPSLNRVTLIGVVGRTPEMRFTSSGVAVAAFRIMTKRSWDQGRAGRSNNVDWFNVIAWEELAETCCATLRKGSPVFVEGHLQQRTWMDESGATQQRIEIVATEIVALADRRTGVTRRSGQRLDAGRNSIT